mmetsp:Transcript_101477/g.262907  ORF Transcript_101477/g.262907 Transcript_101477/m.262907 type:complete len:550 (+) Transcript_101477:2-1651(+)
MAASRRPQLPRGLGALRVAVPVLLLATEVAWLQSWILRVVPLQFSFWPHPVNKPDRDLSRWTSGRHIAGTGTSDSFGPGPSQGRVRIGCCPCVGRPPWARLKRPFHRHVLVQASNEEDVTTLSSGTSPSEEAVPMTSLPAMVVNLVKNIMGASVLTLAAGTAAFSDLPGAVLPASALTIVMAVVCAYTFCLIVRSCELANTTSFSEAWSRLMGERSAWLVSAANMMMAGAGCLQYTVVLADSGSSLAAAAGLPLPLASRSSALLAIAGGLLVPLSFLESCSQLKFTSVLGVCGVMYYIVAIAIRYFQGAYMPGGTFHSLISPHLQPSFGATGGSVWSPKTLVLMSILTAAYVCHYNAPKFYRELENRTLPRFYLLSAIGFGFSGLVCAIGLCCSFLTFGGASSGLIFNNYADTDGLFVVARAIASAVLLCTFPLLFVAFRGGALELLPRRVKASPLLRRLLTLSLVAALTCLGLAIDDVGLVVSVPAAIFGSAVTYTFPALLFLRATRPRPGTPAPSAACRLERCVGRGIALLGAIFATLGTGSALNLI